MGMFTTKDTMIIVFAAIACAVCCAVILFMLFKVSSKHTDFRNTDFRYKRLASRVVPVNDAPYPEY